MKTTGKARKLFFSLMIVSLILFMPVQVSAKSKTAKKALKAYNQMLSQTRIYVVPANAVFGNEGVFESTYAAAMRSLRSYDLDSIGYHLTYEDGEYYTDEGITLKYSKPAAVEFAVAYIDNNNVPELILHRKASKGCECAWVFTYKKGKIVRVKGQGTQKYQFRSSISGYYKKKGIFAYRMLEDDTGTLYLRLKGTKEKTLNCWKSDLGYYMIKGDQVSKSAFQRYLRNKTAGKKYTKIKWYANTPGNRKKHLR